MFIYQHEIAGAITVWFWPVLLATVMMLNSSKFMQFEQTYQLLLHPTQQTSNDKKSNIWNTRDKDHSRSVSFIWRSFRHHAFSKGRKLLHGAGGTMYLLSGSFEAGWFFLTGGNRAPDEIQNLTLLSGVVMALGISTPYMLKKTSQIGFKKYVFFRFFSQGLSCMFSACSNYARPSLIGASTQLENICTAMSFVLPITTLICIIYELKNRLIWSSKSIVLPIMAPLATIYGPLVYGVLFGKAALVQLYQESSTGNAMYVLNLLGGVLVAFDATLATMVLRKVMYFSQRLRIASSMWAAYGVLCAFMISICCSYQAGLVYFLYCGLAFPIQKLIPEWCFDNHLENRKDIVNLHDGHQKGISYY